MVAVPLVRPRGDENLFLVRGGDTEGGRGGDPRALVHANFWAATNHVRCEGKRDGASRQNRCFLDWITQGRRA